MSDKHSWIDGKWYRLKRGNKNAFTGRCGTLNENIFKFIKFEPFKVVVNDCDDGDVADIVGFRDSENHYDIVLASYERHLFAECKHVIEKVTENDSSLTDVDDVEPVAVKAPDATPGITSLIRALGECTTLSIQVGNGTEHYRFKTTEQLEKFLIKKATSLLKVNRDKHKAKAKEVEKSTDEMLEYEARTYILESVLV